MAEPLINPIIPAPGSLNEATAASQGVIFTATDRKIIEERGGEVADRKRSFLDIIAEGPLSAQVENDLSASNPEQNVVEIHDRFRDHNRMVRNAPIIRHKDKIEITNVTPDQVELQGEKPAVAPNVDPAVYEKIQLQNETESIAKELNINPSGLFNKFTLEQKELYNLIIRIKELHLQRLLCGTKGEFESLTEKIRAETLSAGRPEAHDWLESQLKALTKSAAEYKLKLIRSLQAMQYDEKQEEAAAWLEEIISNR